MIIDQPVVSGSLNVTGSSTFVGNIVVTGSISATEGITISGSIASASYAANAEKLDGLDSTAFVLTSSYNVDSSSFSSRTSLIESKYATTGSNTFTGPQYVSHASNAIGFTSTASLYTDGGLRVTKDAFVSGTLYLNNLTVYGTSSIQYITSSQVNIGTNIITVNTDTPAIRFGGLAVYDSGSTGLTGSILWDSEQNHWIYANPSGSTYDGGMIIAGPRNSSGLGNEQGVTSCALIVGQSSDHITSSNIFSYGNATCFYGASHITCTGLVCGNVANFRCIGVGTTSPGAALDVRSPFTQVANFRYNSAASANTELTVINTSNPSNGVVMAHMADGTGLFGSQNPTALRFVTDNIERMRFAGSGEACFSCTVCVPSLRSSGTICSTTNVIASSFTGSLFGTSSQAVSSSYALTASYSANVPLTSSYALEALSSSYALTASYISGSGAGVGFPFSGSAVITGSLLISNLSGSGVRYVVTDENGLMTAQTASTVLKTTQTYTASAGQTTFSVTNGYSTGYVDVFINGSKLNDSEFTDTSGTDVLLLTASFDNDIVEVVKYLPAQGVSNNVLRTLTTFTAANSQSTYNVSYTPGLLDIFYNGSRLSPVEFTANNGTSFTLATASAEGDTLDVLVYSYQVGAYAGIGGSGQLNQVSFYTTTSSISGSNNFTFDGSTLRVTGSIITSGSSTFVNIGPTVLSGSLTVSGSITAVGGITISGSIDSASYASNAEKLDNFDSTAFVFTSSYNTDSGSFSTRVTKIEGNYATTGSNIFMGAQTVCANITSTGTIIAQTLNVQQVTSSIVYSSGSNIFGCSLANTQQFTGSVLVTGSLSVTGPITGTTIGTNDLILNNLNYECANYVDGTRGSWLIQEGACDLFIINQVSGKKYKFNLIEIK